MARPGTQDLIDRLVADCAPVRRLMPPALRASVWLVLFLAFAGAALWVAGVLPDMVRRLGVNRFALEMAGTFLTAAGAVIAAFYLSFPDRSRLWLLLPVPPLVLWVSTALYGCYLHWINYGPEWTFGVSGSCFAFVVGTSIPLAGALCWALRKSCPLDTLSVAAVGGLGVAALAAMTLQFFHPFDVTFIDLGAHLAAVFAVVVLMATLGRERLASTVDLRTNL